MTCDGFRGIAISPILSKVFEHCLLDRCKSLLRTSSNQFGFRKALVVVLPFTVLRITSYLAGVLLTFCAIDLSKAFDKVNHFALFIKVMRRRVPVELLQLMENLFSSCYSCVKWDDLLSEIFSVNFGVRQGLYSRLLCLHYI